MVVPKGYKQTEIGITPEDWDVSFLGSALGNLQAGVSVNSDARTTSQYYVLKTSAVFCGIVDSNEVKPVVIADYYRLKCPLKAGSIIISRMNTPALVGECGYVIQGKDNVFLPDRLWQAESRDTSEFDFIWLNYLLNTTMYRDAVRATATGTSNSMKNISKERLSEITIPKPKKPEQYAIASALSDMDGLIRSLEKLIVKKKNIKLGAMQKLLTGKKRLSGFSGEWKRYTLSDVVEIKKDRVDPQKAENRRCVELEHIEVESGRLLGHTDSLKQLSLKASFCKGDILFGKLRPYLRKYYYATFSGLCSTEIWVIASESRIANSLFMFYVFQSNWFISAANSTTGTKMPRADWSLLKYIELTIPSDLAEQTAIASLLSDMDNEIEALTRKLAKYRNIKQGMMQELLTGRIRLIETAPKDQFHSKEYNEAVVIAALVDRFATEKYPMTAFDFQKFPYLFHRHLEGVAEGYKKFAAGPYNPNIKYGGPQGIALRKKYIKKHVGNYKGFIPSENVQEALDYFHEWYGDEPLQWMEQFRYIPNRKDELELLTTVDMAITDLQKERCEVTLLAVKSIIRSSDAWKDKLKRPIFSDENISRAIEWSNRLFGSIVTG